MLVVSKAMSKRTGTMLDSDVLYGFRLRLFDHAREVGVSEACRTFGVHRSTYYCEDVRGALLARPDPTY